MNWNALEKSALCTVVDQLYCMVEKSQANEVFKQHADETYATRAAAFIDGVRFAAQFIEDRHLGIARLRVKPRLVLVNHPTQGANPNECRGQ